LLAQYRTWASTFHAAAETGCGFVDQALVKLSCGAYGSRDYQARHRLLEGFDPCREIALHASGAFVWTPLGRARQPGVERYLRSREGTDAHA
jgi:hypothetical protein